MQGLANPRGRLPARVYWFRRILVLGTVFALVFAVGRLFTGGSDGAGEQATVTAGKGTPVASARPSATPTPRQVQGPVPIQPATTGKPANPAPTRTGAPVVLAEPTGPCAADEITVTPKVSSAVAGRRVDLALELTGIRPACSFSVSARTLVARVTSGRDRIWTTQECRKAVPTVTVVVRSAAPAKVVVPWHGRRSDEDCSRATPWALPGYYHVTAAVVGSEPGEAQFRLASPPRPVVTKTVQPKPKKKRNR